MLDGSQASRVRTSFIGISERTFAKSISFPGALCIVQSVVGFGCGVLRDRWAR